MLGYRSIDKDVYFKRAVNWEVEKTILAMIRLSWGFWGRISNMG